MEFLMKYAGNKRDQDEFDTQYIAIDLFKPCFNKPQMANNAQKLSMLPSWAQ